MKKSTKEESKTHSHSKLSDYNEDDEKSKRSGATGSDDSDDDEDVELAIKDSDLIVTIITSYHLHIISIDSQLNSYANFIVSTRK